MILSGVRLVLGRAATSWLRSPASHQPPQLPRAAVPLGSRTRSIATQVLPSRSGRLPGMAYRRSVERSWPRPGHPGQHHPEGAGSQPSRAARGGAPVGGRAPQSRPRYRVAPSPRGGADRPRRRARTRRLTVSAGLCRQSAGAVGRMKQFCTRTKLTACMVDKQTPIDVFADFGDRMW